MGVNPPVAPLENDGVNTLFLQRRFLATPS